MIVSKLKLAPIGAVLLFFVVGALFLGCRSTSPSLASEERLSHPDHSVKQVTPVVPSKKGSVRAVEQGVVMNITQAVSVFQKLTEQLSLGNEMDLVSERALIKFLQKNDASAIYADMMSRLTAADPSSKTGSKLQQYILSLLVVVNSTESVDVLLVALDTIDIIDSNAIYATKKSIARLSRSPQHANRLQGSFDELPDDSLFVGDLSNVIAANASSDNLKFLMNYVAVDDSHKKQAVLASLSLIHNEKLVPDLQRYLENDTVNEDVKLASLNTLASMGQYQAVSTLIRWSSVQPTSSLKQVSALFNTALNRSPSAARAIVKELDDYDFVSLDIKQAINNMRIAAEGN